MIENDQKTDFEKLKEGEISFTQFAEQYLGPEDFDGWDNRYALVLYLASMNDLGVEPTVKATAYDLGCSVKNIYSVLKHIKRNLKEVDLWLDVSGKPLKLRLKLYEGEDKKIEVLDLTVSDVQSKIKKLIESTMDPLTEGLTRAEMTVISQEISKMSCQIPNIGPLMVCEKYVGYIRRMLKNIPFNEPIPKDKIKRLRTGDIL